MNEQLKFSWGHIIAFLSIIFLSYVTFVGVTYMTNGDFVQASIAMVSIDAVLFLFFIGAQMAKATEHKFKRWIFIERLFVFCSPIAFCLCMVPFSHFWTVHAKGETIVSEFTGAIEASKQMFVDYDTYSQERIKNYEEMLTCAIYQKGTSDAFLKVGFTNGKEHMQKENMVHTLRLQLLSDNYTKLRTEANTWIEQSSNGASTWNVFLLGNTKEIKSAIHGWNTELAKNAEYIMSNEQQLENEVLLFDSSNASLIAVDKGLDNLKGLFTTREFPNMTAILLAFILYFALMFPYFLQDRHTKSQYRLIGREGDKGIKFSKPTKEVQNDTYVSDNIKSSNNDDDDYASFTM